MHLLVSLLILAFASTDRVFVAAVAQVGNGNVSRCYEDATTVHGFQPIHIDGGKVNLSDYDGQVLLIVNVASFCGFTSQYQDFNKLKQMSELDGEFEILAFPCNQFGYQEPGKNKYEILHCLKYARPGYGYAPNFPIFSKIDVNGEHEIPLFTHLKASCPPVKLDIGAKEDRFWSPFRINDITWNFNKFLIDRHGVPYKRYDSKVEPHDIVKDIKKLIAEE